MGPKVASKDDVKAIIQRLADYADRRAMTHNEKKYPDPEEFKPERFLTPEGTLNDDDTVLTYGFGRR